MQLNIAFYLAPLHSLFLFHEQDFQTLNEHVVVVFKTMGKNCRNLKIISSFTNGHVSFQYNVMSIHAILRLVLNNLLLNIPHPTSYLLRDT